MDSPQDLRYTDSHEWVKQEADGTVTMGLSAHAQEALGEIVYLELPDAGKAYARGDAFALVESVKSASDIYIPVAGEITDVNQAVQAEPGSINQQPYEAWLVRIKPDNISELDSLLSAQDYQRSLG